MNYLNNVETYFQIIKIFNYFVTGSTLIIAILVITVRTVFKV